MKLSSFLAMVPVCAALLFAGCNRNMFDPDAYKQVIDESFPVANIDPNHNWNLTQGHATVVTANVDASVDVTSVRILSGNPFHEQNVEILAEKPVQRGGMATLFYYAPAYQTSFYAALVASDGSHLLKAFKSSEKNVSFESGATQETGTMNETAYQTYTYLFEEDYPRPGDWDFNDLVLRVQKLPSQDPSTVRLRVTLAAVGAKRQMAAAIRLIGYTADDVETVYTEEGRTFDGGYPVKRLFIEQSDLLLRGRNNEAVLNLFEDAHYAMSPRLKPQDQGGTAVRMFYNTSRNPDGSASAQIAPKVITYGVKLRNPRLIDNFTLETLDPFAIVDFNSGHFEIHPFPNKAAQTICDMDANESANSNNMAWALKIPNGSFRYPIEGQALGRYRDGVLTGSYMKDNHSYGQWVVNHNTCTDWFLYPTTGMVY